MASTRKFGHANKQPPSAKIVAPKKDEEDVKTKQKKRKLGDMLGSQWTKKELQQFYEAYRKYGTNWKKVAAAVRTRSVEMVEALYSMNRAYLSLPEGTASVAGLIAMVTDHYCVLERSESEQESNEGQYREAHKRVHKRSRRKYRSCTLKDVDHNSPDRSPSHFVASSSDCLSLLKANLPGSESRVVGKRTPRVPVLHPSDRNLGANYISPKRGRNLKMDADDHVAHEIALALTKASQKDKSPRVSNRISQRKYGNVPSPAKNDDRMHVRHGMTNTQFRGCVRDEQDHEGSMGSVGTDVDNIRRESASKDTEGVGMVDTKEACSGTEEHTSDALKKKRGFENPKQISHKGPTKRSKKILFDDDETAAFEALNTLADLSLSMPESYLTNENKRAGADASSSKLKEDKVGFSKRKQKPSPFRGIEALNRSLINDSNYHREGEHIHVPTRLVLLEGEFDFPSKTRNRRKKDLPKSMNPKDTKFGVLAESGRHFEGRLTLQAKLANCLSWRKAQRWCTFEWFYSAIDYPWFARREFVEYLDHVGLGHIPRLTRVEWGVIRSSLGKPRRFSQQFLKEEKDKLNQYRESVRNHYTELRLGAREGLPTDLARPLTVGQRVIAIHPKTREIHDGSVLTVDCSRCRVQFDKPELGVEFVMDIDCMPSNPFENMPASLAFSKLSENHHGIKMNGLSTHHSASAQFTSNGNINNTDGPLSRPLSENLVDNFTQPIKDDEAISNGQAKPISAPTSEQPVEIYQPSFLPHSKEADVKALYEMICILDKKEALVSEFKHMNDEVEENKRKDLSFEVPEPFSKRYASVLVQLDEVNDQVTSAVRCLRQRNTYQGSLGMMTENPALGDAGALTKIINSSLSDTSKSETHVTDIAEGSRSKAEKMVHAAVQAMSSIKNNSYGGIEGAIDYLNTQLSQEERSLSGVRSSPASVMNEDHRASHSVRASDADHKLNNKPESNVQIPSELITKCVATLFMIQKCTEREFPPADVAQILDSAVTSLQPCFSQNLPIYAEIQKCMGIIRSQILALIRI